MLERNRGSARSWHIFVLLAECPADDIPTHHHFTTKHAKLMLPNFAAHWACLPVALFCACSAVHVCRLVTPLGDDAAMAAGKAFGVDNILEQVARARRRAVGSMFPSLVAPSTPSQQQQP